jgi:UDP-N-acetylmuramate dehydrogenase
MNLKIEQNVSLKSHNSWQVGGEADFFCLPKSLAEVKEAYQWALQRGLQVTVLGGGSNVLISDLGVEGLVICLKYFNSYTSKIENDFFKMDCEAGVSKSELLKIFLKEKLASAEFLAGIPGDVGGGVIMNAGVGESIVPREFTEIVESFEVLKPDQKIKKYLHSEVKWSYRHCHGWQPGIIVRVTLSVPNIKDALVMDRVRQANRNRLQKQPLDLPSCGSVFVNPVGKKAAQLIEQCGLKGFQIGGAQVSKKHANFIVNLGGSTASELWSVIEHVKAKVKTQVNTDLQTEVVRLGRW